ncbi:MAG TPA: GDSL-type esterase/lipase family protein [Phycisphaerales bacterium]|nr:GDSL-type esterase/lipase family protein [Phycisphaerales bacterium]
MRSFAARELSLALGLSCSTLVHAQTESRNLEAAFADTRAALMAGDADIVCIGDSLTFRPGGMHQALRTLMHDAYGNGGGGYQAFSVWTGAGVNPGWDRGLINADIAPHYSLDGMWISWNGTGSTSAFLDAWSPISKIHFVRSPGSGNFLVTHSGGTNFIFTASPEQRVDELTLQHTTTPRAWYYPSGGPVTLLGQNNLSGTPGARVHRVANGGWGVNSFLRRHWTFDEQLKLLTPDLIIVMLGQNDQGFSMSAYREAMDALVMRLRAATPEAEIVLVSSYDSGSPPLANLSIAMEDVALARNVGFINLYAFGGTYAQHVAAARIDPDGVHFTPVGGAYVADFIFDALHTAGRSIPLECDTIDFNLNNVYPEDHDVIDFFHVLAGGDCLGCNDIDFNNNGVFPEDQDVIDFFNVLAGGDC